MLKTGILNPHINSLLSQVRHTNTLVIADGGFPSWRDLEMVDISLVDNLARVLDVLTALRANFHVGQAFMAGEFRAADTPETISAFERAPQGIPITFEPRIDLKERAPSAVVIIHIGDKIEYANLVLESA